VHQPWLHSSGGSLIYGWRKHFGTLEPVDVKRLRPLEQENGRLKRMVADRELEIDALNEIVRQAWFADQGVEPWRSLPSPSAQCAARASAGLLLFPRIT
jgi:hypothetical protein